MAYNTGNITECPKTDKSTLIIHPQERKVANARLVQNKTGETTSGVKVKWEQIIECACDPNIYFIMSINLLLSGASGGQSLPQYNRPASIQKLIWDFLIGFSTFSTIILQSFHLSTEQTILYQLPWYAVQFVVSAATTTRDQ